MKKLLYIFLLLFHLVGYSQTFADKDYYLVDSLVYQELKPAHQNLIDSSLALYYEAKHDTNKVHAVNIIVGECWDNRVWPKYNDWIYKFATLKLKGLTKNDKKLRRVYLNYTAECLNNKGYFYHQIGQIKLAIQYYDNSIKISKKLGDKRGTAYGLINLGVVIESQKDFDKALEYFENALVLLQEIKDDRGIGLAYNNIGLNYEERDDYETAIQYFEKSLVLRLKINDRHGIAYSYSNIGALYYYTGKYDDALIYQLKSLEIKREISDKKGESKSLYFIAKIQLLQNNLREAKKNAIESMRIADELTYPDAIKDAAELLSGIYELEGKYKDALKLRKLYVQMRDSINNEKTIKATAQQQAKYEYEKQKMVDDAEHEKQIAIEQEAKEKQAILTYATAGGFGLVGVFLLIVFNRLKVTRKQKNIIEAQKQEVENQKEVVELAHNELEEKNKEITDSIKYAKRIQNAILPPNKLVKEYLQNSFILYKPKDIVAGDFYWLEQKEGKTLFAAADCTGHGVPGAMVSVVCNNGLNRSVREYGLTEPGEILNKTREIIVQEFEKSEDEVKDGMDIAICSLKGNTLQYAGAHNPLWVIRNDELLVTKANKQPIGQFENPEPYTTHTLELQKEDSIYIFSDGYVDQFGGEKGKKLKTANFKKLLLSIQKENMTTQKQLIDEAFENWKGSLEQLDDVCVIGVKI